MSNILAVTYDQAVAVTKSDSTNDPAGPFAGLYVATAGNVKFNDIAGNTITVTSAPVGVIPIATLRVWSNGTSGTVYGLFALPFRKAVSS
jgi:hypothetical protein